MEALRTRTSLELRSGQETTDGFAANSAQSIDVDQLPRRPANYTLWNALTSSYTWIPDPPPLCVGLAFVFCARDNFLLWIKKQFHSCLLTLVAAGSRRCHVERGQGARNMTPWGLPRFPSSSVSPEY